MESLKPILLFVVLGGIGYLVYVALNRAPPAEPPLDVAPAWNQPVQIETGTPMPPVESRPKSPAALVDPVEAPPSNIGGDKPIGSSGLLLPSSNLAFPPSNQAADAELARQRHEFDAAMRRAQSAIQQSQLVEALRELSAWYDHPAALSDRKAELEDLLSQLAGTVVYSREHWLQPAHVVGQGETLETIAERQQVPWQLLAKINGIENPHSLVPGEQLKVVRGPFHAQLSRQHDRLALFVDGLYAGQFEVQTAGDIAQLDGTFPVSKFPADHPSNSLRQPYISLGGNLYLRLSDGLSSSPPAGTMHVRQRDLSDVFDILSDRSQVTIRR